MCSSKLKLVQPTEVNVSATPPATMVSDINGRPVLQPATSNRVFVKCPLKKNLPPPPPPAQTTTTPNAKIKTTLISPKQKSPRPPAIKRDSNNQSDSKNSTTERFLLTPPTKFTTSKTVIQAKKSKKSVGTNAGSGGNSTNPNSWVVKYSSAAIVDVPGSIAAARREQVAVMQVQRKMKIAHYGRSKFAKYDSCNKLLSSLEPSSLINTSTINNVIEEKRCSFITPNSGLTIYISYFVSKSS